MSASVKIMLSYDYCHFEVSKSTDENVSDKEINEMRKDVQRLADEAVRQYKVAKDKSCENLQYDKEQFIKTVKEIENIPLSERAPEQKAILKQFNDAEFYSQFDPYDYYDDEYGYDFSVEG